MSTPVPKWFKPVTFAITIWMALGLLMFFLDIMTPADQVAALPEAQRTLRETRPLWLMVDFGIATFVGLMGGVALVKRSHWALPMLLVSLVAVTIQFAYTTIGMKALELLGPAHALGVPGFIFAMGAASLWVAIKAKNAGWLSH